ncbi:MAG: signal recognition particle-docking protein FtsY, partial [Acetobacteraceae bacterium]
MLKRLFGRRRAETDPPPGAEAPEAPAPEVPERDAPETESPRSAEAGPVEPRPAEPPPEAEPPAEPLPATAAARTEEPRPAGEPPPERDRRGFLGRLRAGLARSSARLGEGLASLFRKRLMDDAALDELEDLLITADLGTAAAKRIVDRFRIARFGAEVSDQEVRATLAAEIADILRPVAVPLLPDPSLAPHVVLVVGVNGTGKTTTIAKLAALWSQQGLRVVLVAGDTFRAAAVEQLRIWGERTGCPVISGPPNADAAGLAFDALARARAEGADVLLIDTAGRLHNKADLMAELGKVVRVLRKQQPEAPHTVLLVLDATTGQNAVQQVKVFREMVDVTGLVVTKLDGSAKGGVVVALAETYGLPVHAVGVG